MGGDWLFQRGRRNNVLRLADVQRGGAFLLPNNLSRQAGLRRHIELSGGCDRLHCCRKWRRAQTCQNIRPQPNVGRLTSKSTNRRSPRNLIFGITNSLLNPLKKILKVFIRKYVNLFYRICLISRWRRNAKTPITRCVLGTTPSAEGSESRHNSFTLGASENFVPIFRSLLEAG